jgi:hypothetical protein
LLDSLQSGEAGARRWGCGTCRCSYAQAIRDMGAMALAAISRTRPSIHASQHSSAAADGRWRYRRAVVHAPSLRLGCASRSRSARPPCHTGARRRHWLHAPPFSLALLLPHHSSTRWSERALTGHARSTQSPVKRRLVVSRPRWQAAVGGIVRAPHENAN